MKCGVRYEQTLLCFSGEECCSDGFEFGLIAGHLFDDLFRMEICRLYVAFFTLLEGDTEYTVGNQVIRVSRILICFFRLLRSRLQFIELLMSGVILGKIDLRKHRQDQALRKCP